MGDHPAGPGFGSLGIRAGARLHPWLCIVWNQLTISQNCLWAGPGPPALGLWSEGDWLEGEGVGLGWGLLRWGREALLGWNFGMVGKT